MIIKLHYADQERLNKEEDSREKNRPSREKEIKQIL